MKINPLTTCLTLCAAFTVGTSSAWAAKTPPPATLSEVSQKLEAQYAAAHAALKAELAKTLPAVPAQKKNALDNASADLKKAEAAAAAAQAALGQVNGGKALIDHAKNKWIGGAEKGIATAKAALAKATTAAERDAANKELANWEANKADGVKALKERTEAFEKAKQQEPQLKKANDAAQAALAKAKADDRAAANAILADLAPVMGSDKLDAKLVKFVVLDQATPRGLATYAAEGAAQAALLEKLLTDDAMMKAMLIAGGAKFGQYGKAFEIYTAIQKASPKASQGNLQRLALATSLELAKPIPQSNPENDTNGPAFIDPVKRYLHYEKAFLAGELDPAFKDFSVWEYRMVVNCDAPDETLAWGREMLRNYRPDHIYTADYGWRYVAAVKSEVPYGSQNVIHDDPALQQHQNIAMNGGICGRRAFFGRFMLRSFGIPTWGVTQKAHAALSHWTPKGWVVNLGAGYHMSWWDKDEVSMSGTQFLLEAQAREHTEEYLKVLRAQWASRALGEPAYNERKKITGGLWSTVAHLYSVMLSEKAVALGPLGQDLAEANEKEQKLTSSTVSATDQKIEIKPDGSIIVPAVAHGKTSGKVSAMKSYAGGMQIHAFGGFKAPYEIVAPKAGNYTITARVATVQKGQVFLVSTAAKPTEAPVPYTMGLWQQTAPIKVTLAEGKNTLNFELKEGSKGVTIKDFTLTPAP